MVKKKKEAAAPHAASGLVICRNKHWRYIAAFTGPWVRFSPEILASLAHQNYTMPAPRLIDPAVFYDVVKIRRAVDEASMDSVRASNGVANPDGRGDILLSKERVCKVRRKAVHSLAKAFELDEVAASVATMQATSTMEDVASHVLKRDAHNLDAKYVHFFLEKVPSLAIAHFTPLDPLNEILSALPVELQAPPLRTRALARTFKRQWEGAVLDLTQALRVVEDTKRSHKPDQQQLELASKMREEREAWNTGSKYWRSVPQLKDEEQPSSLEAQLLFDRAEAYLALACQSVPAALDGLKEYQAFQGDDEVDDVHHAQAQAVRLEARKKVKAYARRALKDYLAFLSNFDYTPGLSIDITNEIMRRVYDLANGNKTQTPLPKDRFVEVNSSEDESSQSGRASGNESNNSALVKHQHPKQDPPELGENGSPKFSVPKIYPSSALFAEKPLPDLPRFPARDPTTGEKSDHEALGFYEAVTYHPLLNEALHSLLLAHALLQTSPTEHLRHAHNVARLARIADGYPIFQPARSPACSDWTEILRRANNWIGLGTPWQELCTPEPLPETAGGWAKKPSSTWSSNELFPPAAHSSAPDVNETSEQKRERIKQESIADALSDDRVVDEESYYRAVRARERRAFEDEEGLSGPLKDKTDSDGRQARNDIADDYLISTERAEAIARWIREAPLSVGGKKKRPARKKRPAGNGADEVADRVQGLTINERMGGGNAQLKA